MDIDTLRIFADVARNGSFTTVARQRNVDPTSVSRAVSQLEGELGVRLIQRSTRSLALTESGELYLSRIAALVDEIDHARDEAVAASTGPVGTVRLTCTAGFATKWLIPRLERFKARFPQLRLELIMREEALDLVRDRIDLAIRLAPEISQDVVASKLFEVHSRLVASPAYVAKNRTLTAPHHLPHHEFLLFHLPSFQKHVLFKDAAGDVTEVPIHGRFVFHGATGIYEAALQGVGVALLPQWIVGDDIAQGRLVDLLPEYQKAAFSFDTAAWILYKSRRYLPNKVRVTIDFLREEAGRK
jgi:DNA-binding transcriptional LysR family regulator